MDETHSNAFTVWQAMGSPQEPTDAQIAELEEACKLARVEPPAFTAGETPALTLDLARQGVTLIELEWSGSE